MPTEVAIYLVLAQIGAALIGIVNPRIAWAIMIPILIVAGGYYGGLQIAADLWNLAIWK